MDAIGFIKLFAFCVAVTIVIFIPIIPYRNCKSKLIYRHETVIYGSMHRVCIKCGAEFDADYFEARDGGGDVMQYYRMTKRGKETKK